MADDRDIVGLIAEELGRALAPLTEAFESEDAFRALMLQLGWDLTTIPAPMAALDGPLRALGDALGSGDSDALLRAIGGVVTSVGAIGDAPAAAFPGVDLDELPRQIIDLLVVDYLLGSMPVVGEALRVVGVLRLDVIPAAGARPAHLRRSVAWEDLLKVTDDPGAVFRDAYAWGSPDLRHEPLLDAVRSLLVALGLPARMSPLAPAVRDAMAGAAPVALQPVHDWVLRAPLIGGGIETPEFEAGLAMAPVPATASALPGFAAMPYASEAISFDIELSDTLTLVLEVAFDLAGGIAVVVRPDVAPELRVDLIGTPGSPGAASAQFSVRLDAHGTEGSRLLIIGSPAASRFDAAGAAVRGGARMDATGKLDAFAEIELRDGRIVIAPSPDDDGFLAKVLPPEGLTFGVGLSVGLSTAQGLYFGGSGALEVSLPVHVQLGPLEIQSATIAVRPGDERLNLDAAATFKVELGPLKAVVEGIGLRTTLTTPPDRDGALGPIDLALGLKPPTGVGLSIDAGPVKGGGFLLIDADRGEYGGAMELTISGLVSLKAIGLITTRMPDGTPGFSLIVIITAEFGTGLQLGYGFVLKGVGGLLGLNRTMRLQALMEGVKTGAIDGIMFPRDVVANAPRILNDLRTIFPAQEGTFLVGPMAKLGWGGSIVTLSLGVIIQIPPGNIAILGVLRLALPTDDEDAVVVLQVSFAGALEWDRKRAYFFASLFESRILFMTIEGEMGVLVAWGEDANVVVSVGGFHPRFTPPPLPFPSPRRIALSILDSDQAKIRVEGYMAVTTNTAQFGARAELFFGFDSVAVRGDFSFDALFIFRPFSFEIELSASLEAKVFGVGLFSVRVRGTLTGPTPWRIRGTGSISLFLFSVSIDIDKTFGDVLDAILAPIEAMARLVAELAEPDAWRALPPPGLDLLVTLRKLPEDEAAQLLHPVGVLRVSQRTLPLGLTLDRVGQQVPSDVRSLGVQAAGGGLTRLGDATELFAPAQFQDLSDADRLSRPAFGREPSGIELRAETDLATGRMVRRVVRYEEIVLDANSTRFARPLAPPRRTLFGHFLKGSSVARSARSKAARDELRPLGNAVAVGDEGYAVAYQADNSAFGASFASEAAAREHLRDAVAADPGLAEQLHVVPDFELAGT